MAKKVWPTKSQWQQLLTIFNKQERIVFCILSFLVATSLSFLIITFYLDNTHVVPALSGDYSEGMIGSPRFINPIYAQANDIDRDLVELIFSGLMKYENGELVPELAESYEILEDGSVYEFTLRNDVFWHDGEPLTIDDVIFTIKTIQDPEIKSPQRVSWLGVDISQVGENKIRFTLQNPSSIFLEYCTVKIIPKHIWKSVSPENFSLNNYNLKPIGSGPYRIESLREDDKEIIKSIHLTYNKKYFEEGPNIKNVSFYFFKSQEDLLKSYFTGEIKGFALSSLDDLPSFDLGLKIYSFSFPRYFALFLNQEKSKTLAEKSVREALAQGINKEEIVQEILSGYGSTVDSPIMPDIYNAKNPENVIEFNPESAIQTLEEAGFVKNEEGYFQKILKKSTSFQFKSNLSTGSKGNEVTELQKCLANPVVGGHDVYPEGEITGYFGAKTKQAVINFQEKYREDVLSPHNLKNGTGSVRSSTRAKLNELCNTKQEFFDLSFSLITVDQSLLVKTANLLKTQLEKIGIKITITALDIATLERDIIKKRDYEMLLFGEVLNLIPDPFPFWHSSQKKDPGLNLGLYENKEADKILEKIRQTFDSKTRIEQLEKLQEIIIKDNPDIFLYNPDYLYLVSPEIQGIETYTLVDPSKRFSDIENWYIKTKRIWK